MEMVYAKTSRTKLTATEKYESRETDDIAMMPIAIPMIAGPGAITTTIVLMNEAIALTPLAIGVVFVSIILSIVITYYMMKNSDYIMSKVGQREYRAINRLMGMLLIAIAVQFVLTGIRTGISPAGGWVTMQDWDLTSIGLVLIGSSITVAGTIIGVMLLGVRIALAPFLLLTTAVLIVLSAALIVFRCQGSLPRREEILTCKPLLPSGSAVPRSPASGKTRKKPLKKPAFSSGTLQHPVPPSSVFPNSSPPAGTRNPIRISRISTGVSYPLSGNSHKKTGSASSDHSVKITNPLPKNTAVAIGRDGGSLATYAKIHLFVPANEPAGFSPGNTLGIFSLGPLTCGIAICYDLRFPELFRLYAQKGVQVVFVPAAWPRNRIRHWELFIPARAAENQMYVVGVNTTGTTPVDTYSGQFHDCRSPWDSLSAGRMTRNSSIFTDLDPAVVATARHRFPVEKDRKDALYRSLAADKNRE